VAILGPMGSGKTTMVNMLATVLHGPGGFRRPAAPGGGVATHTLEVNEYRFGDVTICDAYGIDSYSWKPQHLRWYVDGTLPKGISLEEVHKLKAEEVRLLRRSKDKRRKDVVLFCVSAAAVVSPMTDPKKREAMNAFAEVRDSTPIIVVTLTDTVLNDVKAETFDQHEEAFARLRREAAAAFCVEARRVFPMMAYRHERQRSRALDLAAYELLEAGAELAGQRLAQEALLQTLPHAMRSDWTELVKPVEAAVPVSAAAKGAKR